MLQSGLEYVPVGEGTHFWLTQAYRVGGAGGLVDLLRSTKYATTPAATKAKKTKNRDINPLGS